MPEISPEPVNFVSVYPAWNNRNLRNLAPKTRTGCMVAHVRAATVGDISESNCHPFQYGNLLAMHNGGIEEFSKIKRHIRNQLSDPLYNWIKGQTDSEHLFAHLFNHLTTNYSEVTAEAVVSSFEHLFSFVRKSLKEYSIEEPAYFNMLVTDGHFMVGTRYVTDPNEEALTLYHSEGSRYVVEDGITKMEAPQDDDETVMIVSEKLTDDKYWTMVPRNHFVIVDKNHNVSVRPIAEG